jgi:lysophospholipase L1-like esterase
MIQGQVIVQLVAAAAGGFVLAELASRAWIRSRREYFVWRPLERMRMRIDREALPMLEPETRFDVNAYGERGDPLPSDREGLYRVLVAGGSAAEGYFLDQSSSWPAVLQERLSRPEALARLGAKRVHVGSIARSLVPCEAIAKMLELSLPRYEKLDLVLFMVGASDIVHWLERRCPPELREGEVPLHEMFDEHAEVEFGWTPSTLGMRKVASRIHRRIGRAPKVRERAGAKLVELRRRRREALEWLDSVPDPKPMLARFERHLREAIRAALGSGARVIVVRQPWFEKDFSPEEEALMWNFCVGRPYVEPTTTYYTHRVVGELMRKVDATAARVADELHVEHLDLMPRLSRDLGTYYDYLHFTPRGARDVAEHVAAAVLSGPR